MLLSASTLSAAELSAEDLDKRRVALAKLLDEQWEYTMKTYPEYASILGDKRYNDKTSDASEAAVKRDLDESRRFLKRFEAIGTVAFSEQEKLDRDLMIRDLREGLEDAKFTSWKMPVTQRSGIHLDAAQFPSLLSFETVKDYDDYITRLRAFPKVMDDTMANMRKGMAAKLMPPKFLLEKVADQASGFVTQAPEDTPFALPLKQIPDSFAEADKTRIRTELLDVVKTQILPSYAKFATFVRDDYAPKGRTEVGVWSLPDGAARYATRAKRSTTTNLTPDEIHQIGVREVARIEGEMLEIAKKLGFNDLKSFNASLETNPEVRAKSAQQILDQYETYTKQMYEKLPQLFGRLPKAKLEIRAIEPFREQTAAGADYNSGAADGSRPGRVNVNTYEATSRKLITNESTAYHEGVPGHHMQISISQELTQLPQYRRQGGYTAFSEGWALYSERLGKEVGFYQNPYSDYGRLQDEMLRAIRLVVDTGLHSKKWTREQVVQYFRDHSALDEVDIQSETDRYISWPGQALAYKIGQLKILELRERAHQKLGDKFDIREFHDEVLGAGGLPMQTLEERIDAWIAMKQRA